MWPKIRWVSHCRREQHNHNFFTFCLNALTLAYSCAAVWRVHLHRTDFVKFYLAFFFWLLLWRQAALYVRGCYVCRNKPRRRRVFPSHPRRRSCWRFVYTKESCLFKTRSQVQCESDTITRRRLYKFAMICLRLACNSFSLWPCLLNSWLATLRISLRSSDRLKSLLLLAYVPGRIRRLSRLVVVWSQHMRVTDGRNFQLSLLG